MLVPPADADAIEPAVIDLLRDDNRRRRLGAAARAVAIERYAWPKIAERIETIYESSSSRR